MTPAELTTREELDALHGQTTTGTWLLADSDMPDEGTICVRLSRADAMFTDAAHNAWPAQSARIAALEAALARQADNMAFVLNNASLPDQWYAKFTDELAADRAALKGAGNE